MAECRPSTGGQTVQGVGIYRGPGLRAELEVQQVELHNFCQCALHTALTLQGHIPQELQLFLGAFCISGVHGVSLKTQYLYSKSLSGCSAGFLASNYSCAQV